MWVCYGLFLKLFLSFQGSRVWIKHQSEVWQCAIVKINYNEKDKRLIVEDEEGQVILIFNFNICNIETNIFTGCHFTY